MNCICLRFDLMLCSLLSCQPLEGFSNRIMPISHSGSSVQRVTDDLHSTPHMRLSARALSIQTASERLEESQTGNHQGAIARLSSGNPTRHQLPQHHANGSPGPRRAARNDSAPRAVCVCARARARGRASDENIWALSDSVTPR